jgi:hypothetical protein
MLAFGGIAVGRGNPASSESSIALKLFVFVEWIQ